MKDKHSLSSAASASFPAGDDPRAQVREGKEKGAVGRLSQRGLQGGAVLLRMSSRFGAT